MKNHLSGLPIGIDFERYEFLIQDCKSIICERVFNSRLELITGYGEVGQRIYNDELYNKYTKGNQAFVERIFEDIGIEKSTGYRCIQFYEQYIHGKFGEVSVALESLFPNEGKSISWNKIVTKYLPDSRKQPNPKPKEVEEIYEKMMEDKKYAMKFIRGCLK